MVAEITLQDFANQTPAERAVYWASFDARMAQRRSLALGKTEPVAAAPQEPAPVATPRPVIVFAPVAAALPPPDPIAEAAALAEAITASAALAAGGVFPSVNEAEALAEAFAGVDIQSPTDRIISEIGFAAEVEALAASITASAEMASDGSGAVSEAEALAREIAASAPQGGV